MSAYDQAVEIAIEWAEEGTSPYDWDNFPAADIRYIPTDMEEEEALDFFDNHPIEAFEAWVSDLDDRSFQSISDALRVLRSAIIRFHAEQDATMETLRINMIDILAELE
jgi:hypothetical protein